MDCSELRIPNYSLLLEPLQQQAVVCLAKRQSGELYLSSRCRVLAADCPASVVLSATDSVKCAELADEAHEALSGGWGLLWCFTDSAC